MDLAGRRGGVRPGRAVVARCVLPAALAIGAAAAAALAFLGVPWPPSWRCSSPCRSSPFGFRQLAHRLDRTEPTDGIGSKRLIGQRAKVIEAIDGERPAPSASTGRLAGRERTALPSRSAPPSQGRRGPQAPAWSCSPPTPSCPHPPPGADGAPPTSPSSSWPTSRFADLHHRDQRFEDRAALPAGASSSSSASTRPPSTPVA